MSTDIIPFNQLKKNTRKDVAPLKKIKVALLTDPAPQLIHIDITIMPEYDMLASMRLFVKPDNIIQHYFQTVNATFINLVGYYHKYDPKELPLSKQDGHPNACAHQILADSLITFIRKRYLPR